VLTTLLLAIATLSAAADPPVPATCAFEAPCVYVTPASAVDGVAPDGSMVVYQGRGWAPGGEIGADFGSFCPTGPNAVCAGVGLSLRFRADSDGRFTFRLFHGSTLPAATPRPAAAGSEAVQFGGPAPSGRIVSRDARRPPAPSTPDQRFQADQVRRAVRALSRAIDRARPRSIRSSDAEQRQVAACQDIVSIERPAARARVIDRVVEAASDAGTYGTDAREFRAFADRLDSLHLSDPALAAGAATWAAAIRAPRHVPAPSLCGELRAWRAAGFPLQHPPIADDATTLSEDVDRGGAVATARLRLIDLGVDRADADDFGGRILGLERYISI
jgi:hypothetical protein